MRRITHPGGEALTAIIQAARTTRNPGGVIRLLIIALDDEKRRPHAADALRNITGQDFGCGSVPSISLSCDVAKWKQWYKAVYEENKRDEK